MRSERHHRRARRGYTLMEMLLVQGVIVALVAMSWPALRGTLEKNRLMAAARQVRTELVQARLKAAETGVPQQFRYQTGDRRYEITATGGTCVSGASKQAGQSAGSSMDRDSDLDEADTHIALLDESITFADPRLMERSRDSLSDVRPGGGDALALNDLEDENWSAPVVFQPNGRSSNARVRLAGPRGYHVDVSLRGLTGAVTVGELRRDEEQE